MCWSREWLGVVGAPGFSWTVALALCPGWRNGRRIPKRLQGLCRRACWSFFFILWFSPAFVLTFSLHSLLQSSPPHPSLIPTNSLPKRPSAPSALLPRSRGKTAPFPSGSASVPTTPSSTTPSADTGAVPSSASKLDAATSFVLRSIFWEYDRSQYAREHLIMGRCESK